ncbi:hypothetical protein [Serratia sp. AKBS12]|uniref:hypothetical protein n=1 Tax=Serratia sp. AKBS12 TaxID=2974597 RepID=UPI002165D332|nr:hypothetical protein [Serratia sp. AKBS12]MCS3408456.1 hypothetical protein [Serratia sp. AKBS12]
MLLLVWVVFLYSVNVMLRVRPIFSAVNAVIDGKKGGNWPPIAAFTAGYRYLSLSIAKQLQLNDKLIVKSVTFDN